MGRAPYLDALWPAIPLRGPINSATHPWNTSCFFALPFDKVCRMFLKEFRDYIAARLGGDLGLIDFYTLGNKLEGEETELWRHSYVVPGALIEMRRRRVVSSESARDS